MMMMMYLVIFIASLQQMPTVDAMLCPHECDCGDEPVTSCANGMRPVRDGCDCCDVCPRGEGESCDVMGKLCDPNGLLECDFTVSHDGNFGVCRVQQGRSCSVNGRSIPSGAVWEVECKERCWCIDGIPGCVPLCPTTVPPPTCGENAKRLMVVAGECCPQWVCGDELESTVDSTTRRRSNVIQDNVIYDEDVGDVGDELLDYQVFPFEANTNLHQNYLDDELELSLASNLLPGDVHELDQLPATLTNCERKLTPWTPCSKTCGLGTSVRMTNENYQCKIERQTRLCQLRPCKDPENIFTPQKQKCVKQRRNNRRETITYAGCTSEKKFRMRYCGLCHQETNKCCTPKMTRTITVDLQCQDGSMIQKKMMTIRSCHCSKHCVNRSMKKKQRGSRHMHQHSFNRLP